MPSSSEATRRLRLTIEYDGTDFAGWQRQDHAPSVQATIEDALAQMVGGPVVVKGAGRTDAGVHARGQVAHFDTTTTIPLHGFRRGLNSTLPSAIAIVAVDEVAADFDARFSALGKWYRYSLWNAESRSAHQARTAWHLRGPLNIGAMQRMAARFIGRHDFAAFRASDCERRTTVRTLHRLDVRRDGVLVTFDVEADAFLKNMVRILVGTLVDIGRARLREDEVAQLLLTPDRKRAGPTAPALGLCMMAVRY